MPERIQRKRTKGWRMPPGTVYVGRGTRWGNPFRYLHQAHGLARVPAIHHPGRAWEHEGRISAAGTRHDYYHPGGAVTPVTVRWMTRAEVVQCYEALLHGDGRWPLYWQHDGGYYPHIRDVRELSGRDLACWCPRELPCHADVLLRLANGPEA